MNSIERPLSWAQLRSEIQEIEDITSRQRERIASGWCSLEKAFGPSWLNDSTSARHPWILDFNKNEPWIKSYYGVVGERIRNLSGIPGFDVIVEKMKSPHDPVAAVAELNAGWKLHKSGIDFRYLETTKRSKTADIRANVDGKEVAVEVTVLRQPQFQIKQRKNLERIWKALIHPEVCSGGAVHSPLSVRDVDYIIEKITEAISTSIKENRRIEVPLRDADEFCVAPKELRNQVDLWKEEHDMSSDTVLFSPDFYDRAGKKVRRRIQDEMLQIGEDSPGIIYIEGFFFQVASYGIVGSQYFNTREIEEDVSEYGNLLFVVLTNLNVSEDRDRVELARKASSQPRTLIAIKNIAPFLRENTWLIINRFHKWPTLRHKKLIRAFWHRGRGDPMKTWERRVMKSIVKEFDSIESKKSENHD